MQTVVVYHHSVHPTGISIPIKVKKEQSYISPHALLTGSGPCLICFALFLILVALIVILVFPYDIHGIGYGGDTIIIYNDTQVFPTSWQIQSAAVSYDDARLNVDVY